MHERTDDLSSLHRPMRAPKWARRRWHVAAVAVGLVFMVSGCGDGSAADKPVESGGAGPTVAGTSTVAPPSLQATPEQRNNIKKILAFDAKPIKLSKPYRIGYLAECINDPYCQARVDGLRAASEKYGFTFASFDGAFNPATQLKTVQDAVTKNFDAYLYGPVAEAAGCALWKKYLRPTDKPVVTVLTMCGAADYTPGTAGATPVQTQPFYDAHVAHAFDSCGDKTCEVLALDGFAGSDLYNHWQRALKKAEATHPNVKVVVNQPGDFDPRKALEITRDALSAHPNLNLVVDSWDDMARGVVTGITASGKKPGDDVRIYSIGATRDALAKLTSGAFTETTALLPYEEAYYGAVALVMALEGQPINGYISPSLLPKIVEGPGTIFITKENANRYKPNY